MSTEQLIREAVCENGYDEKVADALCNLSRYMQRRQWWGACHASSSALYVALSELGFKPRLCIGEVKERDIYFDHSWIELDGKIIDMAIGMTLMGGASVSEPILFGKNIKTGREPIVEYGFCGRGIEDESLSVLNLPFVDYMDAYPDEKDGLWSVVSELIGREIDIDILRCKYKDVDRILIRKK